eukprot:10296550-Prorocentrum_lima.AAC.1
MMLSMTNGKSETLTTTDIANAILHTPNLQWQGHFGCSTKHIGKTWNCRGRNSMEDPRGSLWTQGTPR